MAGLEVLFATVQNQLTSQEDAVVCCLHWTIIHQGLKCIGKNEQDPNNISSMKKSELLPAGWNSSQDVYTLQYTDSSSTQVYLLKVIKMDRTLLVHFMRMSDEREADMMVDTTQYTTEDLSSFDCVFTNQSELSQKLVKEVLGPVLKPGGSSPAKTSRDMESQRQRPPPDRDPLRVPPRHPQGAVPPEWAEPDDPFSIGRGDLDPLAGGRGGGMVFDPFRSGFPRPGIDPSTGLPGRLPPGAVPPGARFDPFGPPDPDRRGGGRGGHRAGPDPDHLPPPGFDDMFM